MTAPQSQSGGMAGLSVAAGNALYGSRTGLTVFQAALANAANAPCNIMACGASRVEGIGPTVKANRWVDKFTKALQLKYNGGISGGAFYSAQYFAQLPWATPWTYAGGPATVAIGLGPGGKGLLLSAGQSGTITIAGSSFDVIAFKSSASGTLGWQIDAGSVTNINLNNATSLDWQAVLSKQPLTGGNHTITISAVSGSIIFEGLYVYNGDENAGVRVYECAQSSQSSTYYAGLAASSGVNSLAAAGAYIQPHLVMCDDFVHNDVYLGVSVAASLANHSTIYQNIASTLADPPSYLIGISQRSTLATNLTAEQQAMRGFQGAAVFFDETLRTPDPVGDLTGSYYDGVHWNNKGNALIADNYALAVDIHA